MRASNGNLIKFLIILCTLTQHLPSVPTTAAASIKRANVFSFDAFVKPRDEPFFKFLGDDASIDGGALQLTPDTTNDDLIALHYKKSGRIMYHQPFRLWLPDDNLNDVIRNDDQDAILASFNSTFLINIFRNPEWISGEGFAFLIAPDLTIPQQSYGQWLGLTNATTDGNTANKIVAIEFDTEKQDDFDPDGNHIGLNINSIRSNKTVSLADYNITISPDAGTNYSVWVQYNGSSKLMEVYMVKEGEPKPPKPLLSETINLKDYVKQDSYFGFAASTGEPEIQLNCVLKWSLEIDILPKGKDDSLRWLKIGAGAGVPAILLLLILCALVYVKKRRRRRVEGPNDGELDELRYLPGMPREFKYKDLNKATNNFHESMKLGEGGFGVVYKGTLHDHTEIAVKKFSRDAVKSKNDFLAELTIIHRLRHKHLVRLVGWCYEKGKLLLVYDFMPNGSLEKHLYDCSNNNTLNWGHRYKILAGIASALHYLHNEFDQKVVHRDLKASNILLDVDFNARLGDFGLARALENERSSYAEQGLGGVPGTVGYVAPECFHTGKATPESDVFGFGAVVLEVVCGRSPGIQIHHHQRDYSLIDWVWMFHREGRIQDAVDERLNKDFVVDEAKRLLLVGLACSHPIASERPRTQDLLHIMCGTVAAPRVPLFKPVFTWPSSGTGISTTDSSLSSITLSS